MSVYILLLSRNPITLLKIFVSKILENAGNKLIGLLLCDWLLSELLCIGITLANFSWFGTTPFAND